MSRRYTGRMDPDERHGVGRLPPPDGELFAVLTTLPTHSTTMPIPLPAPDDDDFVTCDRLHVQYAVVPAVVCSLCFFFGILYCFFGYRYFKATMFLTGFVFGASVTYAVCAGETLLPPEGKAGVAVGAGVLCGLIAMLVQYVGVFLTGFQLGFLLAVGSLVVAEYFVHVSTKWAPIGSILGTGLICALLALRFRRGMTILATSVVGGALIAAAVDYFVDSSAALRYASDRLKAERSLVDPCWHTWVVVALWPAASMVGLITQCRVTGRGLDHREVVHRKTRRKVSLKRVREGEVCEVRSVQPNRYRHLYQIRRVNGDVIAQNYIHHGFHEYSPHVVVHS